MDLNQNRSKPLFVNLTTALFESELNFSDQLVSKQSKLMTLTQLGNPRL